MRNILGFCLFVKSLVQKIMLLCKGKPYAESKFRIDSFIGA